MSRVILISDLDTELGSQLLKIYYAGGYKVIGFINGNLSKFSLKDYNSEYLEVVSWNRTSPVGVKNILLQGVTRFKQIDEALVLQTGTISSSCLEDLSVAEINSHIDLWIKGNLILIKELLHYYSGRKQGTLTLVGNLCSQPLQSGNQPSLLVDILDATFQTLFKHLMKTLPGGLLILNAIQAASCQYVRLAEYIFKITTEKTTKAGGKLFHFSDKKSLLGSFRA